MPDLNILYIEDDPSQREALVSAACSRGFNVIKASSGEEGLAKFDRTTDVILCDLNLPGMDGLEVLRKVKENSPDTPCIVLTSHGSVSLAVQAIKQGATDFVLKPVDFDLIENTIRKAVETRELQRDLAHAKTSLHILSENIPDIVYSFDPTGNLLSLNPATESVLGYKPSEFIGRNVMTLIHPDDRERIKSSIEQSVREGDKSVRTIEFRMISKQGEVKHFEVNRRLVFEEGRVIRNDGVARDITERKKMEDELKQNALHLQEMVRELEKSKSQFEAVFDASPNVLLMVDREGVVFSVNQAVEDLFGIKAEDIVHRPFQNLLDRIKNCFEHPDKFLKQVSGEPLMFSREKSADWFELTKFGLKMLKPQERLVVALYTPIMGKGGDKLSKLWSIVDLTEVGKTTELLRTVVEASPIPFIISRLEDGKVIFVNEPLAELVGLTVEELVGQMTPDFYADPNDRKEVVRRIREDGYLRNHEVRIRKADGEVFWMIFNITTTEIFGEKAIIGGLYDINKRRKAEEALRESEECFRQLTENIHEVFWMTDLDKSQMLYVNPKYEEIWGRDCQSLYRKPDSWLDHVHAEDRAGVKSALPKQAKGQYDEEYRIVRPDGTIRWIRDTAFPIKDAEGKVHRLCGVTEDITERKLAEEAIATRLRYEKGLAGCSQALLEKGDTGESIDNALKHLLKAADVGRAYIFENFEDKTLGLCMRQTYEVCAPGVKSEIDNPLLQHAPYDYGFEEGRKALENGEHYGGITHDMPTALREVLQDQGTLSVILLPIWVDGKWFGFIGFDDVENERIWGEEEIRLLRTAAEMIGGYLARRKAVEALRVSEERFRNIVEKASDVIYSFDKNYELTYLSPRFEEYTGFPAEGFIGRSGLDLIQGDYKQKAEEWLSGEGEEGDTLSYEFQLRDKSGDMRWIISNETIIRDEEGDILEIIGISHDITEMKRVLEDLEKANQHLRDTQAQLVQSEKMASLGMLVAGIAHEINTPIGAVNSMHNTLVRAVNKLKNELEIVCDADGIDDAKVRENLKIIGEANRVIESGTERVTTIVRRLRSFARLDEAELKEADIHEGLEDTLTLIHHEIKHDIKVNRNYGEIPLIACYPGRLNQVFMNLLINARQAIKDKGEITITTYKRKDRVFIEIRDTGVGIPADKLDKVFDPGFTTKGVGVGTGLGLSICYQIIQDHHGEIQVKSEVGKGTTFTIILPTKLEPIVERN